MKFLVSVPLEIDRPLSESDPDVRSITRVPGFIRLEQATGHDGRYNLTFEVEAGSRRDAMDASDELMVEFENALNAYHPRQLSEVTAEAR
ncbi:MAG TPA: hypothetical protein VNU19_03575 [Candidatus Acidoferrum sp.]|jgi:hypothetical protein|nr:hypothetical protein [Candidatus Acidoferrum sp.]